MGKGKPRRTGATTLSHLVRLEVPSKYQIREMMNWLHEEIGMIAVEWDAHADFKEGDEDITVLSFFFEEETAALHFKLRWAGMF